jgi:DNA-binding NtrC family response regulator
MTTRQQLLAFGCREDDVALLTETVNGMQSKLRVIDDPGEFARLAIAHTSFAIVLGIGQDTLGHLDMISVIRAVRDELPVILIAEDASLELERRARQQKIFYYLIHPIERSEVQAVLKDLLRCST